MLSNKIPSTPSQYTKIHFYKKKWAYLQNSAVTKLEMFRILRQCFCVVCGRRCIRCTEKLYNRQQYVATLHVYIIVGVVMNNHTLLYDKNKYEKKIVNNNNSIDINNKLIIITASSTARKQQQQQRLSSVLSIDNKMKGISTAENFKRRRRWRDRKST